MGSDCVLRVVCVIWGKGLGANIQIFFFLSEIIEKLMQNNLINEMLFTSKYLTLSLEKKRSLAAIESLFSVLRKMIIFLRHLKRR